MFCAAKGLFGLAPPEHWEVSEGRVRSIRDRMNQAMATVGASNYGVLSFSNKIGIGDTVAVAASGLTVSCQLRNCTRFRAGTGTCIDELGFHMMTPA